MISLRAYSLTEGPFTEYRVTRQHPQSLKHARKRAGANPEIKEVHQAELRALRVLAKHHPWMLTALAAQLIEEYDEKASQ